MELRQRACSGLRQGRFLLVLGLLCLISSLFSLNADAQLRRIRDEILPQPKPEVLLLQKQWNVVRWYEPTVLHDQLKELDKTPELKIWSESVTKLVDQLSGCFPACEIEMPRIGQGRVVKNIAKRGKQVVKAEIPLERWNFEDSGLAIRRQSLLSQLEVKVQEARQLAQNLRGNTNLAVMVGRTAFTLQRRVQVWRYCDGLMTMPKRENPAYSQAVLNQSLHDIQKMLAQFAHAETWLEYLRVNELSKLADQTLEEQRLSAFRTLARLNVTRLDASQKVVLSQEPIQRLAVQLRRIASQRSASDYLMESVELFEASDDTASGNALVRECLRCQLELQNQEPGAEIPAFVLNLENTYRNANMRLSVTANFLNRFMPKPDSNERDISDVLFNRPIYGKGVTTTATSVQMIPNDRAFHLGFLVQGNLQSNTYSKSTGVTVYNNTQSNYVALKEIQLSTQGIHTAPAVAQAQNQVNIQDLQTSLDSIPLVGFVVNNVARSQAEVKTREAQQISEDKVRTEVRTTLDAELNQRIVRWNELLQTKVFRPLNRLELDCQQIEAFTTKESATMRLRLASAVQPGACTPRPLVPQDSLMSFQLHESVVNNFLQQVNLDGQSFTLESLKAHMKTRFPNWEPKEQNEEAPEDLQVTFAPANALSVQVSDNQLVLRIAIEKLHIERHTWKHFQIHVPFRLETNGMQMVIYRDGVIRLVGHVPVGSQVALRGVFSKIFPKEFRKELVPEKVLADERFAALGFNQCVLQDGWLSLSIGSRSSFNPTTFQASK